MVHSKGEIGRMPPLFLAESYIETQQYAKNIHKVTSDSNHYTLVFEKRKDVNSEIKGFFKKFVKKA